MSNGVENIKKGRADLTDYLIHFTRPNDGKSAYQVLKQILTDGYLTCGWSHRGVRRTIFGTKPAVCFSETPLCGFLDYATKREYSKMISKYGIFIKKEQFFKAGGRPVIYGMTKEPDERTLENGVMKVEGLPESEQYRYILTTGVNEKNDWMHEREWRWANWEDHSARDDMFPIWKMGQRLEINYYFKFFPIGVIVKTEAELNELTHILEKHYRYEIEYQKDNMEDEHKFFSPTAIAATRFLVLDKFTPNERKLLTIEKFLDDDRAVKMRDHLEAVGLISIPK